MMKLSLLLCYLQHIAHKHYSIHSTELNPGLFAYTPHQTEMYENMFKHVQNNALSFWPPSKEPWHTSFFPIIGWKKAKASVEKVRIQVSLSTLPFYSPFPFPLQHKILSILPSMFSLLTYPPKSKQHLVLAWTQKPQHAKRSSCRYSAPFSTSWSQCFLKIRY